MKSLIQKLYNNNILSKLFHTSVYCLKNELQDCESVLDLGCGPSSPLQYCTNINYSVGIETFVPYLEESKKKKIHTEYLCSNIEKLSFPNNSFDAVIMIEVLEHLPEKSGLELLAKSVRWAKKKVIVSSPNGFISQKEIDNNPFQRHLSGWDYQKMSHLGFKIYGLAGLKLLRQEVQNNTMGNDITTSIRFWPKPLWFIVAALSQIATYYIPWIAFELFSVKNISHGIKSADVIENLKI